MTSPRGLWSSANGPRRKILYLVHRVPYPPDKGDRIRTFNILRHLSRRADVYLGCLADEPVAPETWEKLGSYARRLSIQPLGRLVRWRRALTSVVRGGTITEGAFHSPALVQTIRMWTESEGFDGVLLSASSMLPYCRLPWLRKLPVVVDLVDVDSEKWREYAGKSRGLKSWMYRMEHHRLRRLERELPAWTRAVTLVSEEEAELYQQFSLPGAVHAIVNGVDLDYFQPQDGPTEPACVFVGALDYPPNIDGVTWFCREVWPGVRNQLPETKLYLVGRRPAAAVLKLAEIPGVEVVGQVPDVRPYVAKSAVVIAPLQIARGVQNKVLESLAMAKATLASEEALLGLHARAGTEVVVARSALEWQDAACTLLADENWRTELGKAGRLYVEKYHCWEKCLAPFDRLLDLPDHCDGRAREPVHRLAT